MSDREIDPTATERAQGALFEMQWLVVGRPALLPVQEERVLHMPETQRLPVRERRRRRVIALPLPLPRAEQERDRGDVGMQRVDGHRPTVPRRRTEPAGYEVRGVSLVSSAWTASRHASAIVLSSR